MTGVTEGVKSKEEIAAAILIILEARSKER